MMSCLARGVVFGVILVIFRSLQNCLIERVLGEVLGRVKMGFRARVELRVVCLLSVALFLLSFQVPALRLRNISLVTACLAWRSERMASGTPILNSDA